MEDGETTDEMAVDWLGDTARTFSKCCSDDAKLDVGDNGTDNDDNDAAGVFLSFSDCGRLT